MGNEAWKVGVGICDCDDAICHTIKGDRKLHSHKEGNCHHPDGTHHSIKKSGEDNCQKCNEPLKSSLGCHVHSNQCCTKCDWGR